MYFGILVIFVCALIINCNALKCRTDSGPKENELKNVFMNCVKKLERSSSNNSMGYEQRNGEQGYRSQVTGNQEYDDRTMNGRRRLDDTMRDGSTMSDESTSEYPKYKGYHSTTAAAPRRYRRQQPRVDSRRNSGHRSQYNPNTPERQDKTDDSYKSDSNMNMSETNMTAGDKAKGCVIQCFLQDLEMTGENGMPDRYMVTHVITKDVKNEDLKDFLQESIEECFQILFNDNTQDKCEFSKNLMTCLSEKGRSNCDDWKEDGIGF